MIFDFQLQVNRTEIVPNSLRTALRQSRIYSRLLKILVSLNHIELDETFILHTLNTPRSMLQIRPGESHLNPSDRLQL